MLPTGIETSSDMPALCTSYAKADVEKLGTLQSRRPAESLERVGIGRSASHGRQSVGDIWRWAFLHSRTGHEKTKLEVSMRVKKKASYGVQKLKTKETVCNSEGHLINATEDR